MYVFAEGSKVLSYPYSLVELRRDNPNTSFPSSMTDQELAAWGVFPVMLTDPPTFDFATETLHQLNPVCVDGEWRQVWSLVKVSDAEAAARLEAQKLSVRQERDQKLAACDWTQAADAPVDTKAWAVYRQELRNISDQEGFPWVVAWPTQPEG